MEKFDCIVFVGDVTNFGDAGLAREICEVLKSFENVFVLPGNCDPPGVLEVLEEEGLSLHKKIISLGEFDFIGFGGSNPTPFNTPFEMEEEEIEKGLSELRSERRTILVTHAPPRDTKCDLIPSGAHVGSTAVRKVIERMGPAFNICGHVHEGIGVDRIGGTVIVNPGPVSAGRYGIIDTNGEVILK